MTRVIDCPGCGMEFVDGSLHDFNLVVKQSEDLIAALNFKDAVLAAGADDKVLFACERLWESQDKLSRTLNRLKLGDAV